MMPRRTIRIWLGVAGVAVVALGGCGQVRLVSDDPSATGSATQSVTVSTTATSTTPAPLATGSPEATTSSPATTEVVTPTTPATSTTPPSSPTDAVTLPAAFPTPISGTMFGQPVEENGMIIVDYDGITDPVATFNDLKARLGSNGWVLKAGTSNGYDDTIGSGAILSLGHGYLANLLFVDDQLSITLTPQ